MSTQISRNRQSNIRRLRYQETDNRVNDDQISRNRQSTNKGNNKLLHSEQSYKGKVKTHNYINRQNQLTIGKL